MPRPRKMLEPKPSKEELFIKKRPQSVNEALAGVHKAGEYTGFLGDGDIVRKPDYEPPKEVLDDEGKALKKAITNLLMNVIEPFQLSSKSTIEMDKRSFFNKLKKSSLDELKRFLPKHLKKMTSEKLETMTITDEEKAEMQDLYREISP